MNVLLKPDPVNFHLIPDHYFLPTSAAGLQVGAQQENLQYLLSSQA